MGCGVSNPHRPIESHVDVHQEVTAIQLKSSVALGDIETISGQTSPAKVGNAAEELPIDSQRPVDTYGRIYTENFGHAKEDSEVCPEEAARPRDTEPDHPVPLPPAMRPAKVATPPQQSPPPAAISPPSAFSLTLKEAFESLNQPTFSAPAQTNTGQSEKAQTKRELVDELLEHLEDV